MSIKAVTVATMFILCTTLASRNTAFAIDIDTMRHDCRPSYKGYGLAAIKMQEIQGKTVAQFGFIGLYTITNHFGIGGGGFGLAAPIKVKKTTASGSVSEHIRFGYGGIVPEFRIGMDNTIGVLVNAIMGVGGYNFKDEKKTGGVGFFVTEPHLSASIRLHSFLRLNIGAAYRKLYVIGNTDAYTAAIEGASAFCQIQFGLF